MITKCASDREPTVFGEIMGGLVQRLIPALLLSGSCVGSLFAQATAPAPPIQIKVVVVTMFERGEDTGDAPGEFQLWVEREHLDQIVPLPAGYRHVRLNKDGVLGMVTGVGTAKAAASVMALGLDPRFDFSKTYWRWRSGGRLAGLGGMGRPRHRWRLVL
jgi:purine nucleoside permease